MSFFTGGLAGSSLFLILFAVSLNTVAQLLLKRGMMVIGHFEFSFANIWPIALKVLQNPYLLGGMFVYVFSLAAWLLTLSRVEVSVAYPMTSLGYIFTAFVGCCYLNESISLTKFIGIAIIILGVFLVTRST